MKTLASNEAVFSVNSLIFLVIFFSQLLYGHSVLSPFQGPGQQYHLLDFLYSLFFFFYSVKGGAEGKN